MVNLGDFKSVMCAFPMDTFFSDTTPAGSGDIFDAMTMHDNGVLRITACMAAAKLSATIVRGASTATVYFNGNANLTAGALYVFDMPVRKDDVVNFQTSAAVVAQLINVDFIRQQAP